MPYTRVVAIVKLFAQLQPQYAKYKVNFNERYGVIRGTHLDNNDFESTRRSSFMYPQIEWPFCHRLFFLTQETIIPALVTSA
jgi:hypothetical protein